MKDNQPLQSDQTALDPNSYVPPRTSVEAAVAAIWRELLDVDRVGINDNFLLLGGESLLAGQAASRIREQFKCELSLRSILVGTVAEVAAEIVASGATAFAASADATAEPVGT